MTMIEFINTLFIPTEDDCIQIYEKYSEFQVRYHLNTINSNLTVKDFDQFNQYVCDSDSWKISIIVDEGISYILSSGTMDVSKFIQDVQELIDIRDDETLILEFRINKKTKQGKINIYHFNSFNSFIEEINLMSFLKIIKSDLTENQILFFHVMEENFDDFFTSKIKFYSKDQDFSDIKNKSTLPTKRENCNFGNQEEFPFNSTYFELLKRPLVQNNIADKLDALASLFALVDIFDISSIRDNTFSYKLNGYKTIEGSFDINSTPIESGDIYLKIRNWIYSKSGNITDKLGLARNILSIYLNDNSLKISENVYYSIQSGFKTYLQENLNRYIDIRNKISDQLIIIIQKSNDVIEKYIGDFQKSIYSFVSFFISVFVIRVLSKGDFNDIFTKDATYIALFLIFISFIYFVYSYWNLSEERSRLTKRYENLKNRFKDLLVEDDIKKILRDDKEFNEELEFIDKRRKYYSLLWVILIFASLILIFSLSTFLNWKVMAIQIQSLCNYGLELWDKLHS